MANVDKLKHKVSSLIREFEETEAQAPFIFDIEGENNGRYIVIIVRIFKKTETTQFWKTIFKIKSEAHLDIFCSFLQFLSSANLQQAF